MKPYYEHAGITIFHGDCADVITELSLNKHPMFDLLLTDPPYGIGEAEGKNKSRGCIAVSKDYGVYAWDNATADREITLARSISKWQIIFGGNYYHLPPTSCWLVWDKDNGATDFADCELAWTNLKKAVRRLTYRWQGMLQQPGRRKEIRQHPTQKPEPVMVWALSNAPDDVITVLDPFMGSGTTLVACKRLARKCVGIERDERYCAMAAERLSQESLRFEVTA